MDTRAYSLGEFASMYANPAAQVRVLLFPFPVRGYAVTWESSSIYVAISQNGHTAAVPVHWYTTAFIS